MLRIMIYDLVYDDVLHNVSETPIYSRCTKHQVLYYKGYYIGIIKVQYGPH